MSNNNILYIYGYGSNPNNSFTMNELKKIIDTLGYNLISIKYDQEHPNNGIAVLEKYIKDNNIKYIIGHSLGGFIALCISNNVKKLVINPCIKPYIELPKIANISNDTINEYEYLYKWLYSGHNTPWVSQLEDVMGLFGDHDELIDYYEEFKKQYPLAYRIKSGHRPKEQAYTNNIKNKIKEFFC